MLNEPWQGDRVFTTPVGTLAAGFLLRPYTMFHPEGEWSVRIILPPDRAHLLRQTIAPAYEDILKRGRQRHAALPFEQQISRPFKENVYWQAVQTDGGLETDDLYFTFRAAVIEHDAGSLSAPDAAQPDQGIATRIPLFDRAGQALQALSAEPDGQEGIVSFSIHQFWLRSFGAGVTLRLKSVQVLGPRQHPFEDAADFLDSMPAVG